MSNFFEDWPEDQLPQGAGEPKQGPPLAANSGEGKPKNGRWDRLEVRGPEALRNFLSRAVPWPTDGEPGFVSLHWHLPGPKARFPGRWFRSIDEFIRTANEFAQSKQSNLYFCLSRQALEAVRNKENALAFRAVWADLDIKASGYPTIVAAIDALFDFIKHYNLPPPSAIVLSGNGMHVYWFSDRSLSYAEWHPYAEGLKAAALQWGLRCDAGLMANGACVLRIPGTRNFKTNPPKPVRLYHLMASDIDFAADLKGLLEIAPAGKAGKARSKKLNKLGPLPNAFKNIPLGDLGAGIEGPPAPSWPAIKAECAWLREAFETGGKDYDQPQWNLTALAMTFLENGKELLHQLSDKHPDYNKYGKGVETEALWERKVREQKEKNLGWPSCKAIADAGSKQCKSCPHFTAGESPLHLGLPQQESVEAEEEQQEADRQSELKRRAEQIAENIRIGDDVIEPTLPQIMSLKQMRKRLVFVGSIGVVADLATGCIRKKDHAADEYAASQHRYIGKNAAGNEVNKTAPALKCWLAAKDRKGVEVLAWVPGSPQICQPPEGPGPAFNMWRGLTPMACPENWQQRVRPFLEHVEYLVPIEAERERFLQWLAHIVKVPEVLPHTSYLMITPKTGIGRNLLASILVRALRGFVAAGVSLPELLDGGFTGRLSQKLLVVVDEAREGSGERRYQRATRLTALITEEHRHVNHKYGLQSVEKNCGRWLKFSNFDDAIPLDNSDRRVIVIANPTIRKPDAYYERLYGMLNDQAFIGSVRHWLETRDIAAFRPGEHAPMNQAKLRVLNEMMSETERAVAEFKEDCGTELVSRDDIKNHVTGTGTGTGKLPTVNDTHLTHAIRRAGMMNTGHRIRAYREQRFLVGQTEEKRFTVVIVRGEWNIEVVKKSDPGKLLEAMGLKAKGWSTVKPQR